LQDCHQLSKPTSMSPIAPELGVCPRRRDFMPIDISSLDESLRTTATDLAEKIDFQQVIDKGQNGYVLIGQNKIIDRKVVVKFYYWGDGEHAEPKLLSQLSHPRILPVHDAAAIDKNWAYFITPCCEQGDLDAVIQNAGVGIRRAIDMILDVASGVAFMHGKGFLHRDLKPANIFLDNESRLLIGDFGSVAEKNSNGYVQTLSRHSLIYRTPEEVQLRQAYDQSDIYQLGIIFYQLLGGYLPYEKEAWLTPQELAIYKAKAYPSDDLFANGIIEERIKKGKIVDLRSLPPWCPPGLVSLIRKCCSVAHSDRLESVSAFIARLNNLRSAVPDWRLEPEPALYRDHAKFRVVENGLGQYRIEKMAKRGKSWRIVHSASPSSLKQAIGQAEAL